MRKRGGGGEPASRRPRRCPRLRASGPLCLLRGTATEAVGGTAELDHLRRLRLRAGHATGVAPGRSLPAAEGGVIYRADILHGDARDRLRELSPGSVQCCISSPPYWGLRDYGVEAQIWGGSPDCAHAWDEHERYAGGAQPGEKV